MRNHCKSLFQSCLLGVLCAGSLSLVYAAQPPDMPGDPGSLQQRLDQSYTLMQEKQHVQDELMRLGNDKFRTIQSLYQLEDNVIAHNLRMADLEKTCLNVPLVSKPTWCDARWDEAIHTANEMNQQLEVLKAGLRNNNDNIARLDNRHDEIVHEEYALRESILQTAQDQRIKDPCFKQASLSQMVQCKYPKSALTNSEF